MENFISAKQAAQLLGVSKVTLIKQIKTGKIPAEKVGNNYIINRAEIGLVGEKEVTPQQKTIIEQGVKKTIQEYGETLKMLKDA